MEIVKLNNRYLLGREGYTHALRFTIHTDPYYKKKTKVIRLLEQLYGNGTYLFGTRFYRGDTSTWATYTYHRSAGGTQYYVGVKDESMLTAVLLMVE